MISVSASGQHRTFDRTKYTLTTTPYNQAFIGQKLIERDIVFREKKHNVSKEHIKSQDPRPVSRGKSTIIISQVWRDNTEHPYTLESKIQELTCLFKSLNAPIAAFTMAIILCSYCFSSIRAARREAQQQPDAINPHKRVIQPEKKESSWVQQALDESRIEKGGKGGRADGWSCLASTTCILIFPLTDALMISNTTNYALQSIGRQENQE